MELKTAIEEELSAQPAGPVRPAAAGLSERYRAGGRDGAGYFTSAGDIAAYAAFRMPATYAAVHAALTEAALRLPGFSPRTMLDAGAGPGTAAWAAAGVWPGLAEIELVEREPDMIALGRRLAERAALPALRAGRWVQTDLAGSWQPERHDLVVLSYALGELREEAQAPLVRRLWEAAGSLLVLVEPGTTEGFRRVRTAREALLGAGARILAPCPHGEACPMAEGNWCHFSARVARSRLHRQTKGAALSYEDEKFSYLVAAKEKGAACAARVLRHPQVRKGHVELELCTAGGLARTVVSKSQGERYRQARDLKWGAAFHLPTE